MNGEFSPTYSSNMIWRDDDDERCITVDLDEIEADITLLQSGKANTSHSHSYNDLTDTPTNLPANGGNADTVDGKHANEFATAIGAYALDKKGTAIPRNSDLNDYVSGNYYVDSSATAATITNTPTTGSGYRLICQVGYAGESNGNYNYQIAFTSANRIYYRVNQAGNWAEWQRISAEGHTHNYLPLTGGSLTGPINITRTDTNFAYVDIKQTVGDDVYVFGFTISNEKGFFRFNKGSTILNTMTFDTDCTYLGKPLVVGSGGTGATTKSGARVNLGIMSGTSDPPSPSSYSAGDIYIKY